MNIKLELPEKNPNGSLKNVAVIKINGESYVYVLKTLEIVGLNPDDEKAVAAREFIKAKGVKQN